MLSTAEYPFLAVNLDFSNVELEDGTPPIVIGDDATMCAPGQVVKSCYLEVSSNSTNVTVGLIGRAPADFFNVIENPATTLIGLDFVGGRNETEGGNSQPLESALPMVLEQVDLLEAQGINIIILLDHAQDFTGDPLSANLLRGIDVIVAAGSTGFMAGSTPQGPFNYLREGAMGNADYPTIREDMEGNEVLVVNSDQLYAYIGHLIVEFSPEGTVLSVDDRSGPIATTPEAVKLLATELGLEGDLEPIPAVRDIFDELEATHTLHHGSF